MKTGSSEGTEARPGGSCEEGQGLTLMLRATMGLKPGSLCMGMVASWGGGSLQERQELLRGTRGARQWCQG